MFGEALAVTLGGVAAMSYAVRGRSATWLAPSEYRGPRDRRSVALTFDDGPSEGTEQVLALLDKFRAKATFFQCGKNVRRLPEVSRMVMQSGHEIGNHSYSHARLYLQSRQTIEGEFRLAQEAIQETVGRKPKLMRPPFGVRWFGFRQTQRDLGLLSIMWTVIGLDWKLPSGAIVRRLVNGASNGAILCLHDGRELQPRPDLTQTIRALGDAIPALLDQGYRFETVSELLCLKN